MKRIVKEKMSMKERRGGQKLQNSMAKSRTEKLTKERRTKALLHHCRGWGGRRGWAVPGEEKGRIQSKEAEGRSGWRLCSWGGGWAGPDGVPSKASVYCWLAGRVPLPFCQGVATACWGVLCPQYMCPQCLWMRSALVTPGWLASQT